MIVNQVKDWETRKLLDVCEYIQPGFAQGEKDVKDGIIHLRMNNIGTNFKINFELVRTINATTAEIKKYSLRYGDLVFNNTNSSELVGKSAIFKEKTKMCLYSNHLTRLQVRKDTVLSEWVLYYIRKLWLAGEFKKICNKWINQAAVNSEKIKNLEIPIPPLDVQEKIVQKLECVLGQLEEKRKILLELKKLQKTRLEYIDKQFADDVIDQIFLFKHPPENWEQDIVSNFVESGYIIEFQDGNHGELHPKKSDFSQDGRPFITASQIDNSGKILWDDCKKLPEEFCKKLRIGFAEPNDVLFTHNATVGRVAILPTTGPHSVVGTSVTYYRLNKDKIYNKFFFYLMRSRFIRNQYEPIMKQTTRNQFSKLKQAKLNLIIPPISEQYELVQKLDTLFSRMNDLSPALKSLIQKQKYIEFEINSISNSILEQAFSGKLVN